MCAPTCQQAYIHLGISGVCMQYEMPVCSSLSKQKASLSKVVTVVYGYFN